MTRSKYKEIFDPEQTLVTSVSGTGDRSLPAPVPLVSGRVLTNDRPFVQAQAVDLPKVAGSSGGLPMRKQLFAAAVSVSLVVASAAYAWGGTFPRSGIITSQTFPIKLANGGFGQAKVTYKVDVVDVIQEGNNGWGRTCQFVPVSRVLTRSVVITAPGLAGLTLADAVYKEPIPGGREFNDNCNNHASGDVSDFSRYQDEAIGNANTWATQIGEDRAVLKQTISMVGELII
jgi:hypothetical protein